MDFLKALFTFLFGVRRTYHSFWVNRPYTFDEKNLLGVTFYNFGSLPAKVNGFVLRAYDENRGPDSYVLDTLPIMYEDRLQIKVSFEGDTVEQNKVYIAYSTLNKC